jgi:alpha-galactosidase
MACTVELRGDELIARTRFVERRWRLAGATLRALSLRDLTSGREWCRAPSERSSLAPAAALPDSGWSASFSAREGSATVVGGPATIGELTLRRGDASLTHRITAFAEAPAIALQLVSSALPVDPPSDGRAAAGAKELGPLPERDVVEALEIAPRHLTLIAAELHEATDVRQNLVFERRWLLHPSEAIAFDGNLLALEDLLTGDGIVFVRQAPLPYARAVRHGHDCWLRGGTLLVAGHGLDASGGDGYPSTVVCYSGGEAGRIAALQRFQRALRRYLPERDGLFLTNTWGDRNRDGRLGEAFVLREIEAAAALGADVVQIDDGWQQGVTQNSVKKGGVWEGFWSAGADFWTPHRERFPRGLGPVVEAARAKGLRSGLWFAPDSSGDFANWRRDAEVILGLHRAHGIDYFKVDAVKMRTKPGERNVLRFYEAVLGESGGRVVIDQDVTDEVRPGYLAVPHAGPLFVENRYTDWGNWWPHATLRNLWQLSRWIDPLRLRMELLNHHRNPDQYAGDPLAPSRYRPSWLFASVMAANPLGWFECSQLPPGYVEDIAPLAWKWREHRSAIHGGAIIPIGDVPDGSAWSGFISVAVGGASAHVIVLRGVDRRGERSFELPLLRADRGHAELLGGEGSADWERGELHVRIPEPLGFAWLRLRAA